MFVGRGFFSVVFSSVLWVGPGVVVFSDCDFAVSGTWEANGEAYFWGVSVPTNFVIIDTVTVDARTINDVKISADGRIGVMTREGASSRKNGVVILDVSNPYNVIIFSEFNDGLTGGVHNAFIYDIHVYAVNNGRKYDIINISDPSFPWRVFSYELNTPGHSFHVVWIENGIAYSSYWSDGVHVVVIGGLLFSVGYRFSFLIFPFFHSAGYGCSCIPFFCSSFYVSTGRNHAAFPFFCNSSGCFFVLAGGDHFPFGFGVIHNLDPANPRGGYHFFNMLEKGNPVEEAFSPVP
jgi:Uncharacterized conserved protein